MLLCYSINSLVFIKSLSACLPLWLLYLQSDLIRKQQEKRRKVVTDASVYKEVSNTAEDAGSIPSDNRSFDQLVQVCSIDCEGTDTQVQHCALVCYV